MAPGDAPAPAERGWAGVIVGLVAFLILPSWFRWMAPVTGSLLLLLPALGTMMVLGWWAGGGAVIAVLWVGVGVAAVMIPAPHGAFDLLQRGWAVLVAASFGVACITSTTRPLVGRALIAIGMSTAVSAALLLGSTGGMERVQRVVQAEFAGRVTQMVSEVDSSFASDDWKERVKASPKLGEFGAAVRQQLQGFPEAAAQYVIVAPALLALESILAVALAWALYHRLSRARLGPPLGRIRDFRFSDHLVWGVVAGLVMVVVAPSTGIRYAGVNLLVFFGALYVLRGFGVLWWFVASSRLTVALMVLLGVLLAPVAVPAFVALALGLGVGDTWLDWRNRARPTIQSSE